MPIRVLIADDHAVVRRGLRLFLELDADLEVVGEAFDGAMAVRLAHKLRPDVTLMDLLMPVMDGIEATAAIRREIPGSVVLGLTSAMDDHLLEAVLRAGAACCLLKDASPLDMRRAIKAAAAPTLGAAAQAAGILDGGGVRPT